jgi:radical SAM superfamily enzyme YgiQ (UPF0313 family)
MRPGASAVWGPNLWLVHVDDRLELSGNGHLEPLTLGSDDVDALLAASRSGAMPSDIRPALREALRIRGWDPAASTSVELGQDLPSLTSASITPWRSFPLLIWVVGGRAVAWSHDSDQLAVVPVAVLQGLVGAGGTPAPMPSVPRPEQALVTATARFEAEARDAVAPSTKVPLWFATCAQPGDGSPLALGMISSAVRAHDGGRLLETYEPAPIRMEAEDALGDVLRAGRPGVLLLSNYLWTIDHNLELAAIVKRLSPGTITVFGGPSAPKYEADAEVFLRDHPQVDVVVRGEGEVTVCELLDALGGDLGALDALPAVAGLTLVLDGRTIRTADRERMSDLDQIPSPYLTGLFEHLTGMNGIWAVETNRGCPYGCTFCDWGSATLSRVRKFDLERVRGEITWLAEHHVQSVFIADANLGLFERDVDIARHVVEQKLQHGSPSFILATFAKNTTKHTLPIVELLVQAGLASEATLSFQTTDPTSLVNIRRHNVKAEVYEDLANDARARGIPVLSDLMMALPGSDMETFKTDLQVCMDGDVATRAFGTIVLTNSPMNDPEYRERFAIETDSADQVVASSTFTRADREEMVRFRDLQRIADHFGVLREVVRWVQREQGVRAVDVLWDLYATAVSNPERYPASSWFMLSARRYLTVPLGWPRFFHEIGTILREVVGVADDESLRTVLRVQEALLPAPGRQFPDHVALAHDYVAFRHQTPEGSDPTRYRPLREFGPGELTIDDPSDVCRLVLRETLDISFTPEGTRRLTTEGGFMGDDNWELDSALARPMRGRYMAH